MTSSFAEFLKKEKVGYCAECEDWRMNCPSKDGHRHDEYVSLRALGDWAWSRFIPWFGVLYADCRKVKFEDVQELMDDNAGADEVIRIYDFVNVFWEIAVACLGEVEVKKRLVVLR